MCLLAFAAVHVCALEPGVCYSLCSHAVFHQGPSCGPQTLGVGFHSLETPSAAARGWMISNTWEPWDPTQRWNNRGPVSVGARNRTRRQAVMMSESFTPTHAPPTLLSCTKTPRVEKRKSYCTVVINLPKRRPGRIH